MKPKIVRLPAFIVAGLKYRGDNKGDEIPLLWADLTPRVGEIGHRVEKACAYGVSANFDRDTGEFDYIAGFEVTQDADLPADMAAVHIPTQTYAVFDCILPNVKETFQRALDEWLPTAGYEWVEAPDFELYDERFDVTMGMFDMSIYLPIKDPDAS